jgi:hypothetical protein
MTISRNADVGIFGDREWPFTDSRHIVARMIKGLYYFFETGNP